MDTKARGVGRYFYEYIVHQAVERYPAWRAAKGEDIGPLRASQGREARRRVDEELAKRGASMDRLGPGGPAVLLESVDAALGSMFADYQPMFVNPERGAQHPGYAQLKNKFGAYIGSGGHQPVGGVRLPVSPFDPRWSHRETVMDHGTEMLSILDEDVRAEVTDETGFNRLDTIAPQGVFDLYTLEIDENRGTPAKAGPAHTTTDVTGLSALRPYMRAAEFRELAPWVTAGASQRGPMGAAARERALAILEYLNESGVDYRMVKDRNPGQIAAAITGSRASIRITDTGADDAWVGRVYDDGIATFYSEKAGKDGGRYEASPAEAVELVKFALGERIERFDGKGTVGVPGERSDTPRQQQDSYHAVSSKDAMLAVREGLWIRRDASVVSQRSTWFADEAAAGEYLQEAVATARAGLESALDVDGLIAEAAAYAADPEHIPDFSGLDDNLVSLKTEYWKLLTDPDATVLLLNPGVSTTDYVEALEAGDVARSRELTSAMDAGPYPADKIRVHAGLVVDSMIGQYEPDAEGIRFDPVRVAQYMTSEHSVWRNNDDIVAACAKAGVEASSLRGDDYYNRVIADNLLEFDPETAVAVDEHPSPVIRALGARAKAAIERGAADVTSISIDDNGVIQWSATRRVGIDDNRTLNASGVEANARKRYVTGTIGQVFARGEHNEVVTKFAGGDNFLFMPGFEASVVSQKPGENLSLEQRTRLKGYEQVLGDAIEATIAKDIANPRSEVGRTTSLNSTVRRLAANRHPVNFMELTAEEGLSESWRDAILETEARRVRYPTELAEGSTALKHRQAQTNPNFDQLNDNSRDPLILTGMRNMSVLDREAGRGYFDPMMTGMAANQGVVRYLTPGAKLTPDGAIVPSDTPDARVPVAAHEQAWAMGYDPHDRQNMTFSNIMQASAVVEGAKTAMVQAGGWNFEDGIVISEEFARNHPIRATDGQMRPLTVGDKLSDFHGNKGVISLIVDREMDAEQAAERDLSPMVTLFADNKDLDVVMSPFSPISRFNGGTARELMTETEPLVLRGNPGVEDGEENGSPYVVPSGMGELNLIVTHMSVDAKTNVYDAEAMAAGRGRKASSQLAWALQSQGAFEVMREFYGDNTAGLADVREYLLVLGMEVEPDGRLATEPSAEALAARAVFSIPEPIYYARRANEAEDAPLRVNHSAMAEQFGESIAHTGGLMELPFELKMADGGMTPASPETEGMFVLPVLSAKLRSSQDMADGSVRRHDHTKRYMAIFEAAVAYQEAQENLAKAREAGNAGEEAKWGKVIETQLGAAQRAYDAISGDIISRKIESKSNMFKESIMSHRLSHSATAVWTGDPRLAVDQVAMNSAMAVELGVPMMTREDAEADGVEYVPGTPRDDGYVMVWRDPVLRDGGVRYLRVTIDDSLTGVAINPASVKSMDGDFDGDSVGLVGNLGPFAHFEALEKLTVEANLLDRGQRATVPVYAENEHGELQDTGATREVYPLSVHTNLDIEVACKADPQLRPFIDQMTVMANDIYESHERGEIGVEEFCDRSRAVMQALSGSVIRDGFANQNERIALSFGSLDEHMASVRSLYEVGGKGSASKLLEYGRYLGAEPAATDENGLPTSWRDVGAPDPEAFDEKYRGSQAATAFKTQITGIAGAISQNAIQLTRGQNLVRQACEISYPATQSVLQAKHDPVDAAYRADIISGAAKDLWRGYKMEANPDENGRLRWEVSTDRSGKPMQASVSEWTDQFMRMYADPAGMGVPIVAEHVNTIAQALSDSTGHMLPTDRDRWEEWPEEKLPLTLDRLAYGGSFDDLLDAASRRGGLFEGINASFAPKSAINNLALTDELSAAGVDLSMDTGEVDYVPIDRADTRKEYQRRLPRSEWTTSTRSPGMGYHSRPSVAAQAEVLAELDRPDLVTAVQEQPEAVVGEPVVDTPVVADHSEERCGPTETEKLVAAADAIRAGSRSVTGAEFA